MADVHGFLNVGIASAIVTAVLVPLLALSGMLQDRRIGAVTEPPAPGTPTTPVTPPHEAENQGPDLKTQNQPETQAHEMGKAVGGPFVKNGHVVVQPIGGNKYLGTFYPGSLATGFEAAAVEIHMQEKAARVSDLKG